MKIWSGISQSCVAFHFYYMYYSYYYCSAALRSCPPWGQIPFDFIIYFIAFQQISISYINRVLGFKGWSKRHKSTQPTKKKRGGQPSNRKYELSTEQKEALVGLMLGDGYLERSRPTHNTRLAIDQAYPEKEEYVNSLFELFKPMVSPNLERPNVSPLKPHKKTGKVYYSIRFRTLVHPCLNKYHDLFYKENKKVVPANLG